ncbi:MAG: MMPL family transporter, partial [Rhodothermia bacterium]
SIGLAFVFISLIMALLFRSAALLIISLLPNVFPLIVTAGFMGLAGIDIKPATAVIFSISFGIAVDDTIHFLARLRQELRLGRPMRDAIRLSLLGTGKAIILTSIILAGGFAVLTTSQFQSSNYMGGLISLTLVAALAADLLLLPALLHAWIKFSTVYTRED